MSVIVISAADEAYADLLADMVLSVRDAGIADLHIGCLDLGLKPQTRAQLQTVVNGFVRPAWPFRPHPVFDSHPRHLSRAVRPFLPRYFPGYRTYIWLDADCWVHDKRALLALLQATEGGALAAVPATDRSYVHSDSARAWVHERNRRALGEEAAAKLRPFNYVNAGVLAARGDSVFWQAWASRFQDALDRWEGDFLSDQAIVNALIYLDRVPAMLLPAEYNWICHLALPLWLPKTRQLANPSFPWPALGIAHNTHDDKRKTVRLNALQAPAIETTLRYAAHRERLIASRNGTDSRPFP